MCCPNRTPPRSKDRGRAGFTLIELLAALGLLGILIYVLTSTFVSSSRIATQSERRVEVNQITRAVIQQITFDLERAVRSDNLLNMHYTAGLAGSGLFGSDPNFAANELYFLADVQPPEMVTYGSYVSLGYRITQRTVGGYNKWVLERGDDPDPSVSGLCSNSWWVGACPSTTNFWKLLSENVVGLSLQFSTTTSTNLDPVPVADIDFNNIPYSIGVSIYTIDTRSYNRALDISPSLTDPVAQQTILNNLNRYYTRIYIPRSSQNN
jgi:prepilin-type N-terminal cleavage/methylation domain-containing protein